MIERSKQIWLLVLLYLAFRVKLPLLGILDGIYEHGIGSFLCGIFHTLWKTEQCFCWWCARVGSICEECGQESEYDIPYPLCERHWNEWYDGAGAISDGTIKQ